MSAKHDESVDLIKSKALLLRGKLKAAEVKADEKTPAAAVQLLSEFSAMATELYKVRTKA